MVCYPMENGVAAIKPRDRVKGARKFSVSNGQTMLFYHYTLISFTSLWQIVPTHCNHKEQRTQQPQN